MNERTESPCCEFEKDHDTVVTKGSPGSTQQNIHVTCPKKHHPKLKKKKILKVQDEFEKPNFLDELEVAIDK